jgi:uncharacterized protein
MNAKKYLIGWILMVAALAVFLTTAVMVQNRHAREKYALFNAARDGDLAKVKLLIQRGAPINLQVASSFGWTPLIGAIYQGQTNVVYYLVENGADVNLADKDGVTPLMWLTSSRDEGVPLVKYLIAHGANLDAKNKRGMTVFDYATGDPPAPRLIEALEAAKFQQKNESQK